MTFGESSWTHSAREAWLHVVAPSTLPALSSAKITLPWRPVEWTREFSCFTRNALSWSQLQKLHLHLREDRWSGREGYAPMAQMLGGIAVALGATLVELRLTGGYFGTLEEAAATLRCLPMFVHLGNLTLEFSVGLRKEATDAWMQSVDDACLQGMLVLFGSLRVHSPRLRSLLVMLPSELAVAKGGRVTWGCCDELCAANRGLAIDWVYTPTLYSQP